MNDHIETLISQMTLEEKVALLAGADKWTTVPVERLGIPAIKMTDGPHGARGVGENLGPSSAAFPVGVAMAATWNPELVEREGRALAEETKAKGAHILLGPTVNIHRSPLAGRNFECYSEDPHLSARLAVAYIRGLQSQGVGACVKHFVCNDSEFERTTISSEVSERALREIYLVPFQAAVQEAHTWAVMSSYNKINGVYASENSALLLDLLKKEWGFDGVVISDWYGTYSPKVAQGGLDIEMPGPARWMGEHVLNAVRSGQITEEFVNDKVRRILRTIERVGAFGNPELAPEQSIDRPEHRSLARQAAGEAIVLLKNDRSALPLELETFTKIAVIGENALWAAIKGGGSSRVSPHYVVAPLEAIIERAGPDKQVEYQIGCMVQPSLPVFDANYLKTESGGQKGMVLEYFDNAELAGEPIRTEVTDRMELIWFGDDAFYTDLANFSVRLTGIWTAPETGEFRLNLSGIGKFRLLLDGETVIDQWDERPADLGPLARVEQAAAVHLEAGQSYRLTVEYASLPGASWRNLRLGGLTPVPEDPIAAAVQLAADSDVALIFAGHTADWESEGFDRPHMDLRGDQNELIERVAAANPNTIVVLNTGSPVHMPWLDKVAAVLEAWYPGQEAGNAIADILFGDRNPSGKLPVTFPKRLQDNPACINYPGENGMVYYGEGIFVGYRYYDKKEIEPLFPFGHGLSYTTFAYRNLRLNAGPEENSLQVEVEVQNTGSRQGQEIVQIYVRDPESRLARPEKELKGFAKVDLGPGESKTVIITLDEKALSYYDPGQKAWVFEPGKFQVLLGASSADIRLVDQITIKKEVRQPQTESRLHMGLPLRVILEDEAGKAVLEKYVGQYLGIPELKLFWEAPFEQIAALAADILSPDTIQKIKDELESV